MEESVRDAVKQVRQLQDIVAEQRAFRGFSGHARIISGAIALAATAALSSDRMPPTPSAHLAVWGAVLAIALALNFGALWHAFRRDPEYRRAPSRMRPVLDVLPPLAVGGGLSLALILAGQYDLLFGTWMACYGLAHLAARRALPPANAAIGLFYLASAALQLLQRDRSFLNPWPMALAFFPGELAGGLVLERVRRDARRPEAAA